MIVRNKTHRRFKIFLILIGLLVLVLMNHNTRETLISWVDKIFNRTSELQLDTEYKGENLNYYNDTLIRWKDNKITYFNKDGSENWTKKFDFMYPEIYFGEEIIYIMDKSTGDIYLMDNKGDTLSRIQIEGNIFNLKESNNCFLVHSKQDKRENLFIFDKEGNNIGKLDSDVHLLAYSINEKGNKYSYSTTTASEEGLNSILYVKNIDSEENHYIELSNEVIIFTEFIDNRIIALTDENLYLIENDNMVWSYSHEGIQDILVKGEEICILNNNVLDIIDLNGEINKSIDLSIVCNRILDLDDYIGVFGQNDLVILQNHEEILKYIGEGDIIKVTGNDKNIAIHYIDKVDIFKL